MGHAPRYNEGEIYCRHVTEYSHRHRSLGKSRVFMTLRWTMRGQEETNGEGR